MIDRPRVRKIQSMRPCAGAHISENMRAPQVCEGPIYLRLAAAKKKLGRRNFTEGEKKRNSAASLFVRQRLFFFGSPFCSSRLFPLTQNIPWFA